MAQDVEGEKEECSGGALPVSRQAAVEGVSYYHVVLSLAAVGLVRSVLIWFSSSEPNVCKRKCIRSNSFIQ